METQQKSSSGSVWIGIIAGLVLMLFGGYLSYNQIDVPGQKAIVGMGIPIDLGMTIATIGVFLILFKVIDFFFTKPLNEAITDRTQSLESTFSEAENLRAEMQKMRTEYEQRLAVTEANARDQIQAQIREAQNLRSTLMAEAGQRADEMVARAQQEIEAEKQKALTELRLQVVDLTLTAAEKILGENMDSDKNRRLVTEFIDKVEVTA
jgi:F-type H+-transporting ATPase subunit b